MNTFNPARPKFVSYPYAKKLIQSGWIGQYRGTSYISRLIQYATGSVHSHSAMFRKDCNGDVDVLEMREFQGGQTKTLHHHVENSSGLIDVFSCNAEIRWRFDQSKAVEAMRQIVDGEYGYSGVLQLALRRTPGIWRMFPIDNSDVEKENWQPFCSHAVALATAAGGVDPVPNWPSYLVTPGDLTKSLFFEYQFTIQKECKEPWAPNHDTPCL